MGDLDSSTPLSATSNPIAAPGSQNPRQMPVREDCWSEEASSTLVDAWGRRYLELNRGNLRQKDWQDVAAIVNDEHGHTPKTRRTDVQCKNRVDTIKKKYKIEKARVTATNGNFSSSWIFYDRMDALIGSNLSVNNKPPSPSLSPSPPVALPLLTYRNSPSSVTPIAVALPQKRSADDGTFRRNYSAMAAAAAASAESDESEEVDEREENDEEEGGGMRKLARSIERFSEVYERVEGEKLRQMVELEKQRMEFTKDLEVKRMRMLAETQLQLEKINRDNRSGSDAFAISKRLKGIRIATYRLTW